MPTLSHSSATLTLERWCSGHGLAPDAKLVARLERGTQKYLEERIASGWRYRPMISFVTAMCGFSAETSFCRKPTIGMCPAG